MSDKVVIRVEDLMTDKVVTIDGMATVSEAMEAMRQHRVSSLIVDRRDDHDEYGMLVVSDIAKEVIVPGRSPDRVNVYEIMSKPVLTLHREMNIKYAARLLVQFSLSRGIIVDGTRTPLGIVTLRDMVLRTDKNDSTQQPEHNRRL